jgi:hypothetical protein
VGSREWGDEGDEGDEGDKELKEAEGRRQKAEGVNQ